jgi:hypothetical protein
MDDDAPVPVVLNEVGYTSVEGLRMLDITAFTAD